MLWDREVKDAADEFFRGGHGASFWVEGEAGIGKTRLVDQFARWVEDRGEGAYFLVTRGAAALGTNACAAAFFGRAGAAE